MEQELKTLLFEGAAQFEVPLTEEKVEKFGKYMDLLLEWNQKINLTAICDPKEVVSKHFVDSLSLLSCGLEKGISLIDVGTGAGFPGVPLLIARPDLSVTMMDSLAKRLTFLEAVLKELELSATLLHMRAEDGGQNKTYREAFDVATARAVANLSTLSEYCLPFVKKGGRFLAMKGDATEEIKEAVRALSLLGGEVTEQKAVSFDDWNHRIVVIKKVSTTPSKYPRKAGKPSKEPLK